MTDFEEYFKTANGITLRYTNYTKDEMVNMAREIVAKFPRGGNIQGGTVRKIDVATNKTGEFSVWVDTDDYTHIEAPEGYEIEGVMLFANHREGASMCVNITGEDWE